ncbi:hypothetical protein ACNKHP_00480 [Shigella boydii]
MLWFAWSGHDAGTGHMGMATMRSVTACLKLTVFSACYMLLEKQPRLDGAFTMYYMSVNIGSFFSMIATPSLAAKYSWSIAFA